MLSNARMTIVPKAYWSARAPQHACTRRSRRHRVVANSGRAMRLTQLVSRPSVRARSMKARLRSARQSRPVEPDRRVAARGHADVQAVRERARDRVAVLGRRDRIERAGGEQDGNAGLHGRPARLGASSAGPLRAGGALLADAVAAEIGRVVSFGRIGRDERHVLGTRDRQIEPVERARRHASESGSRQSARSCR